MISFSILIDREKTKRKNLRDETSLFRESQKPSLGLEAIERIEE